MGAETPQVAADMEYVPIALCSGNEGLGDLSTDMGQKVHGLEKDDAINAFGEKSLGCVEELEAIERSIGNMRNQILKKAQAA